MQRSKDPKPEVEPRARSANARRSSLLDIFRPVPAQNGFDHDFIEAAEHGSDTISRSDEDERVFVTDDWENSHSRTGR